jgi:hypothetical protein
MNTTLTTSLTPPSSRVVLRVEPWVDDITAELGHDLRSPYAERFWLSVLGPSALWLARSLAYGLDGSTGFNLDVLELARALGLGDRTGRHAPVQRAVERLCHFDLAYLRGGVTLVARQHVAWLDDHRLHRLSDALRAEHRLWEEADALSSPGRARRRRAAAVAYACARNRGTPDDIARVLAIHGLDLGEAHEFAQWATEQVRHRPLPESSRLSA